MTHSSKLHLDHPGEWQWFKGYTPGEVVGSCPHVNCSHHQQTVIAWGPDSVRYELVTCDVADQCNERCRSWTDGSMRATSEWLRVSGGLPR